MNYLKLVRERIKCILFWISVLLLLFVFCPKNKVLFFGE